MIGDGQGNINIFARNLLIYNSDPALRAGIDTSNQ
ncbi:hypothetical protein M595_6537, partial [Lyngbya aestuarii BL J]